MFLKAHEFWLVAGALVCQIANKVFDLGFSGEEINSLFGLTGSYAFGRLLYKGISGKEDGGGRK